MRRRNPSYAVSEINDSIEIYNNLFLYILFFRMKNFKKVKEIKESGIKVKLAEVGEQDADATEQDATSCLITKTTSSV